MKRRRRTGVVASQRPVERRRSLLLRAVAVGKEWMGTDVVRGQIVRYHHQFRPDDDGRGRGATGSSGRSPRAAAAFWMADLAQLDERMDDAGALHEWIRAGLGSAPYPRLFPLRWHDHYTALVVWRPPQRGDARYHATVFDPHEGAAPRRYTAPPVDAVVRSALAHGGVGPSLTTVVPPRPSQHERSDTLCVVWMTMFLCRRWRPNHTLRDAWRFLQSEVRRSGNDFVQFCREEDPACTPREARALHDALVAATVTEYRAAFEAPDDT